MADLFGSETRALPISSNVISREIGDTVVLINLATNHIYELNSTGGRVWELVRQGLSLDAVFSQLAAEFGTTNAAVQPDVESFLDELRHESLLS